MTIEEKAKAYDKAIEKIKYVLGHGVSPVLNKEDLQDIFPELSESEDERIRKAIHIYLDWLDGRNKDYQPKGDYSIKDMIAWLEKQGEYANFHNKIQVGDKVTRNRDGVLVNLSQLKRVAKPSEKQGEKKPAWSEEDEQHIDSLLKRLDGLCRNEFERTRFAINEDKDWLESLKQRIGG